MPVLNKKFWDTKYNPFSDGFSRDKFCARVDRYLALCEPDKYELKEFVVNCNKLFRDYFSTLSSELKKASKSIVLDNIMSVINTETINLTKIRHTRQAEISISSMKNIILHNPNGCEADTQAYVDAYIDFLNIIYKHISRYKDNEFTNISDEIPTGALIYQTSYYNCYKELYELLCWDDYDVKFGRNRIDFVMSDIQYHKRIYANRIRFDELLLATRIAIEEQALVDFPNYELKSIEKLVVCAGTITVTFGNDVLPTSCLSINLAFMAVFYDYIVGINLDVGCGIDLMGIIIIFSSIQDFLRIVMDYVIESEIDEVPYRIVYRDLVYIISFLTNYSVDKIEFVLELLCNGNRKSDLYRVPFIRHNDHIYFSFSNSAFAYTPIMIDYWLSQCGYDLGKRGPMFEEHVKSEIRSLCNKLGFFCNVIEQKTYIAGKKREEIDLVVELKDIIIVGEIKCLPLPLKHIEYHSFKHHIDDGKKQIIRKTDFLKRNLDCFSGLFSSTSKRIVPVVISNLPVLSGDNSNSIPVIDTLLLLNWFSGRLAVDAIHGIDSNVTIVSNYYANECEFNSNMEGFFHDPTPISEIVKSLSTRMLATLRIENVIDIYIQQVFDTDPLCRFKKESGDGA